MPLNNKSSIINSMSNHTSSIDKSLYQKSYNELKNSLIENSNEKNISKEINYLNSTEDNNNSKFDYKYEIKKNPQDEIFNYSRDKLFINNDYNKKKNNVNENKIDNNNNIIINTPFEEKSDKYFNKGNSKNILEKMKIKKKEILIFHQII